MMIRAVLGNPNHPEYGVATIPFPYRRWLVCLVKQYHCSRYGGKSCVRRFLHGHRAGKGHRNIGSYTKDGTELMQSRKLIR